MESFGQTKARESQEELAKKKRRGGNDSIQFLREKSEKELEGRKQERKLKEKEQERLFEQQREMMRLMQSQQQSMMDISSLQIGKQVTLTAMIYLLLPCYPGHVYYPCYLLSSYITRLKH